MRSIPFAASSRNDVAFEGRFVVDVVPSMVAFGLAVVLRLGVWGWRGLPSKQLASKAALLSTVIARHPL